MYSAEAEPGFLCGTQRGCVGGSGSITCCNSKALKLLGQLPQCQLSLQAGAQCPQKAAAVLIFWYSASWLRAGTGAVTVTQDTVAQHSTALAADWLPSKGATFPNLPAHLVPVIMFNPSSWPFYLFVNCARKRGCFNCKKLPTHHLSFLKLPAPSKPALLKAQQSPILLM